MEKDMSGKHEEMSAEFGPQPKSELNYIAEALGLIETPDLIVVRQAIVEARTIRGDTETAQALIAEYQAIGEVVVEAAKHYSDAQIGLIITVAAIRRDIGDIGGAIDDLQDALIYAQNMGHNELVLKLQHTLAELQNEHNTEPQSGKEIAQLLLPYDDHGLDMKTRTEIAAMPFDEAFQTAYGYLIQAGLDPDEILTRFMQPE